MTTQQNTNHFIGFLFIGAVLTITAIAMLNNQPAPQTEAQESMIYCNNGAYINYQTGEAYGVRVTNNQVQC